MAADVSKIIRTVSHFYKVPESKLLSLRRGRENEPRDVSIYLIRILRGEKLLTIGKIFNLQKHSSVSSVLERTRKRFQSDRDFRNRVNKIKIQIYKKGQ